MDRQTNYHFYYRLAWLFWLAIVAVIFFSYHIPKEIDFYRYMAISHHIYTSGNWLTLYFDGKLYVDKPPLLFWLIALGWKIFGVNEWWPTLLCVIASSVSILTVKRLATKLYSSSNAGLIAASLLVAIPYFAIFSSQVRVDAMLVMFSLLSIYFSFERKLLLNSLVIGLGLLTKGPLFLLTGLLPTVCYLALSNKRNYIGRLILSYIAGCAIFLLWYAPMLLQNNIFSQQLSQMLHRVHESQYGWWFYLENLPILLFPLWLDLRFFRFFSPTLLKDRAHGAVAGSLLASVVLVIIFSSFGQRSFHYLFILLPIVAIGMAKLVESYPEKWIMPARWFALVLALVGLILAGIVFFIRSPVAYPFVKHLTQPVYNTYLFLFTLNYYLPAALLLGAVLVFLLRRYQSALLNLLVLSLLVGAMFIHCTSIYYPLRLKKYFVAKLSGYQVYRLRSEVAGSGCYEFKTFPAKQVSLKQLHQLSGKGVIVSTDTRLIALSMQTKYRPLALWAPDIHCVMVAWPVGSVVISDIHR